MREAEVREQCHHSPRGSVRFPLDHYTRSMIRLNAALHSMAQPRIYGIT